MVAEELVDEVEIFLGDEHHVTAEAFPHFDEVSPPAGYESPHAAETCGHRRAVGNQYSHSYHPHIAACSSRQCRQLADGTCLALRAGQLLVHHLVLVHDEEDAILPAVMPGDEEICHAAEHEEECREQQEAACDVPQFRWAEVAFAASHEQNEQPHDAEADAQHPEHFQQDAGVLEHGNVVHPAVLAVGAEHGVCGTDVAVLLSFCLLLFSHSF